MSSLSGSWLTGYRGGHGAPFSGVVCERRWRAIIHSSLVVVDGDAPLHCWQKALEVSLVLEGLEGSLAANRTLHGHLLRHKDDCAGAIADVFRLSSDRREAAASSTLACDASSSGTTRRYDNPELLKI